MLRSPCILVVDDEPAVRGVIRAFLERIEYVVLEANSGEEALAVYLGCSGEIDLVVSDVRMPGMDGNELARRIHDVEPAQRFLFVTAYPGDVDDSVRRFESVPKPFTSKQLLGKVSAQFARRASA